MDAFAVAVAVSLFAIAIACGVLLWLTRDRPEPFECGTCGKAGSGARCRVIEQDEDPVTGEGWAMVADFHPECCPVIDPDHVHAR
jgi:hypothetical protein